MKPPQHATTPSFEANPIEAKEALRNGEEGPLAAYLAGLAEGLSLLAESIHQSEDDQRLLEDEQTPKSGEASEAPLPIELEEEWDASLHQFAKVLREGNDELIALYLREASIVLAGVSRGLQPASGARGWKLEFKRTAKGRPVAQMQKMLKDSAIRTALFMKTLKLKKQEAAIADIKEEKSVSRATQFRAKRAAKKAKSHKKP
jgi:hypothetical protein